MYLNNEDTQFIKRLSSFLESKVIKSSSQQCATQGNYCQPNNLKMSKPKSLYPSYLRMMFICLPMEVSCCLDIDTWLSWLPVPVLTTLGTLTGLAPGGLMVLMASERFSRCHLPPLPPWGWPVLSLQSTKPLKHFGKRFLGSFEFPIKCNASAVKILSTSQHQIIPKVF